MRFINLTPHTLNIHTPSGVVTLAPSGEVARVATVNTDAEDIGGIPTVNTTHGEVTGLPAPQNGVVYIVSGMVASAAPREDVLSPGDLVRDENGRPCGCKGLRRSC
jgi:hypothetical protein